MSKLFFRKNGEEHNFWQNYTDLMSGLLIVFIIISFVEYSYFKDYAAVCHKMGVDEDNIEDVKVSVDMYKKINEFQKSLKDIKGRYFNYNDKYRRFECTVSVQFMPDSCKIPEMKKRDLINAGKEIDSIVGRLKQYENISYKLVIDGRAAKSDTLKNPIQNHLMYVEKLGYNRALELFYLWRSNNVFSNIDSCDINDNILVTGSGYRGDGRYKYGKEDRNKTFIIQIIPYIKY